MSDKIFINWEASIDGTFFALEIIQKNARQFFNLKKWKELVNASFTQTEIALYNYLDQPDKAQASHWAHFWNPSAPPLHISDFIEDIKS